MYSDFCVVGLPGAYFSSCLPFLLIKEPVLWGNTM